MPRERKVVSQEAAGGAVAPVAPQVVEGGPVSEEAARELLDTRQKEREELFVQRFEALCNALDLQMVPVPYIAPDGRIRANLTVGPRPK